MMSISLSAPHILHIRQPSSAISPNFRQNCNQITSSRVHGLTFAIRFTEKSRIRRFRRLQCSASLITDSDSFQVGRLLGTYGFMNITSYSGFQGGVDVAEDIGKLKSQDVGEGSVNIRLYDGRIVQGPLRGTPVTFKVYPGAKAGGPEADMMAANELNAHASLQSSSREMYRNLVILLGGFETKTGEQWLAFRNDGRFSAVDYARYASERMTKALNPEAEAFWNPFQQVETIKRRRYFVVTMLQGISSGLAFMHGHDRLHQSLGPASVVLNTRSDGEAAYLIARLRDLAFSVDIRFSLVLYYPQKENCALHYKSIKSTFIALLYSDPNPIPIPQDSCLN